MTDYRKLYTLLFNAFTDAVAQLDLQNYGRAREVLICAQQNAEDIYLADDEDDDN